MKKIRSLDGLRGLMTINVVLNHFIIVFFPAMFFLDFGSTSKFQVFYSKSPFAVLTNGNIAVQYFFVLSGFLVALSIFNSKKRITPLLLLQKIYKRYLRLLPMIFISVFFAYLLMKYNLMFHLESMSYGINVSFIENYNNFTPNINTMLYDAFIGTYYKMSIYNGPFWTIKFEVLGYITSLISVALLKESKYRRLLYIVLAAVLYKSFIGIVPFIFGVFVADLYFFSDVNTTFLSTHYNNYLNEKWFPILAFLDGLYLACVPNGWTGIHSWLSILPSFVNIIIVRAIGVAILIYAILRIDWLQKYLESEPLLRLGKISFSIYAFHWPIMLSLEHFLFLFFLENNVTYFWSSLLSLIITMPIIIFASYFIYLIIEEKKWKVIFNKYKKFHFIESSE